MLAKSLRNKIFSACIFTLPALLISVCCALLFGLLVNSLNGQIIIGANWLIRWLCRVHGAVGERVGSHLPAGVSAAGRRAHLVLPASHRRRKTGDETSLCRPDGRQGHRRTPHGTCVHVGPGSILSEESNQNVESKTEKSGVQNSIFTARRYASAVYAMALCLSVTSRCSTKTAKRRITQTIPHDSPGTLVF